MFHATKAPFLVTWKWILHLSVKKGYRRKTTPLWQAYAVSRERGYFQRCKPGCQTSALYREALKRKMHSVDVFSVAEGDNEQEAIMSAA